MQTVVKVKRIVATGQEISQWVETYVEIPTELFESALREKKATQRLDNYAYMFKYGMLKEHTKVCKYIENKIGRFDWADIQRIKII